eukprot:6906092-Ditylum_brightwellii.AAC.1
MSCKKIVRKVIPKADKKHACQIIAYLYQDEFDFPPRDEWKDFVNLVPSLKEHFVMEKGTVLFVKICAPLIPVESKAKL